MINKATFMGSAGLAVFWENKVITGTERDLIFLRLCSFGGSVWRHVSILSASEFCHGFPRFSRLNEQRQGGVRVALCCVGLAGAAAVTGSGAERYTAPSLADLYVTLRQKH